MAEKNPIQHNLEEEVFLLPMSYKSPSLLHIWKKIKVYENFPPFLFPTMLYTKSFLFFSFFFKISQTVAFKSILGFLNDRYGTTVSHLGHFGFAFDMRT